ncbi:HPr family phosphocarrier protein [Paenibacillus sp. JX-17]|uniref:HPr family phosphocarrier protein n=1 Tax=Paenibacillus lacisoli TaxID=3064525 RepID=A0ABT9CAH4_9BACL|nr:HPr family phosphocarrier protein [Paenibacillus sp. JX-17]MDO7905649.1 HPr family phosphocarrier protein [Paenibacillus sp. JX-17]
MRIHDVRIFDYLDREELIRISSESARFMSDIKMSYRLADHDHLVDVKSLLGMIQTPIQPGTVITLRTQGKDELEALEYMLDLFESRHHA